MLTCGCTFRWLTIIILAGRLRWLDSLIGVDEEVTKPFTNLTVTAASAGAGLSIGVVNKVVKIGADGLPLQATVNARKARNKSESC